MWTSAPEDGGTLQLFSNLLLHMSAPMQEKLVLGLLRSEFPAILGYPHHNCQFLFLPLQPFALYPVGQPLFASSLGSKKIQRTEPAPQQACA